MSFTPPNRAAPTGWVLVKGQSNAGYLVDSYHGYQIDAAFGGVFKPLVQMPTPPTLVIVESGYDITGSFTTEGGVPAYDNTTSSGNYILDCRASGAVFSNPNTWPLGTFGHAVQLCTSRKVGTLAAGIPIAWVDYHSEYDSTKSDADIAPYGAFASAQNSKLYRSTQPNLDILHQAVFFGTPGYLENVRANAYNTMLAGRLAAINDSSQNCHWFGGNNYDCVDVGDLSHMDATGDYNASVRGLARIASHWWEMGFLPVGVDLSMVPRNGPIYTQWMNAGSKTVKLIVGHDTGTDIVPAGNFNPKCFSFVETNGTEHTVLGFQYLNNGAHLLTLDGDPSSTCSMMFCPVSGYYGVHSLPTDNAHLLTYPSSIASAMAALFLQAPMPFQRSEVALLNNQPYTPSLDNALIGSVVVTGGGPTPFSINISKPPVVAIGSQSFTATLSGTIPTGVTFLACYRYNGLTPTATDSDVVPITLQSSGQYGFTFDIEGGGKSGIMWSYNGTTWSQQWSATPAASVAFTLTVPLPPVLYTGTQTFVVNVTGTIPAGTALYASWHTTGTPALGASDVVPITLSNGVYSFIATIDHAGTASTMWIYNGTAFNQQWTTSPYNPPANNNPPPTITATVQQPSPFVVGSISFPVVLSSGAPTGTTVDLNWNGNSAPAATDPGWVRASGTPLAATVTVSGPTIAGTLWYRINAGAAVVAFTGTPQAVGGSPPTTGGGQSPLDPRPTKVAIPSNYVLTAYDALVGPTLDGTLWSQTGDYDVGGVPITTITPPPASGGGSVSGSPTPGDVTSVLFHLTAKPWTPPSVTPANILSTLKGVLGYLANIQTSNGAIPLDGSPQLQATACFAYGCAVLANTGDQTYLTNCIDAMNYGCSTYHGSVGNTSDGPEFQEAPLANAALILKNAGLATSSQLSTWASGMSGPPLQMGTSEDAGNWGSYGMYGTFCMGKIGWITSGAAQTSIENYWNGDPGNSSTGKQSSNYDGATGLFIDGTGITSMAVEIAGRRGAILTVLGGYSGPSAGNMKTVAFKGTATTLLLQDPSGQGPCGGRTDDHVWTDAGNFSIFAAMANYYASSNIALAGQYQEAANLSYNQLLRWKYTDGSFRVTKNFYPDTGSAGNDNANVKNVGYQNASSYVSYNANVALGLAEAYTVYNSSVVTKPAPTEVGGYGINTGTLGHWCTAFANAGGTAVEIETAAPSSTSFGNYWNSVGIVRIGTVNWDTRMGPSDGSMSSASSGVSFAPAWANSSGTWTRLASNPSYTGAYTTLMASPVLTKVRIVWTASGNPTFTQNLTITPDGVLSQVSQSGAPGAWGQTFPLLHDDGKTTFTQTTGNGIASVSNAGSTENFIAIDSGATLTAESNVLSTYGEVTPVRAAGCATAFVYPSLTTDPTAASVKSSFEMTSTGFTSTLGWVSGALYSGRTSAGGFGSAISLSNGSTPDINFNTTCNFICRVASGVITSVETDRAVTANAYGNSYTIAAYTVTTITGGTASSSGGSGSKFEYYN